MNVRNWRAAASLLVKVVVGEADERLKEEEDNDDGPEYSVSAADIFVKLLRVVG